MEQLKRIFIGVIVAVFVLFALYIGYSFLYGYKQFVDREYTGVITNIRKLEFSRGLPDIKINDEWIPLSVDDSKVMNYMQIGDSIVKKSGYKEIIVYRRDINGEWNEKIFK